MPNFLGLFNGMPANVVPVPVDQAELAKSGLMKLLARFSIGTTATTKHAALILTPAEERVIFGLATDPVTRPTRWLLKTGAKFFLIYTLADFTYGLVIVGHEPKTLENRLEIISAHVVKAGNPWLKAVGVAEQVVFIIADALGVFQSDGPVGNRTLLGDIVATVDVPFITNAILGEANLGTFTRTAHPVDVEFESAGFILNPVWRVPAAGSAETFPSGPRPSFGRRS
jgi:hypothetical protein